MIVFNDTKYSDKKIEEIIAFVRPNKINFTMLVEHTKGMYAGVANKIYKGKKNFVRVYIGKKDSSYPYKYTRFYTQNIITEFDKEGNAVKIESKTKKRAYLPKLILSREEALVYVIAHELRHVWQFKGIKRGRVWGSKRNTCSEIDADAYGIKMMRKWRKSKSSQNYNYFPKYNF